MPCRTNTILQKSYVWTWCQSPKNAKLGISGKIRGWISKFPINILYPLRSQTAAVNQAISVTSKIKSSVPQGTVLAPLLFLILIHNIDMCRFWLKKVTDMFNTFSTERLYDINWDYMGTVCLYQHTFRHNFLLDLISIQLYKLLQKKKYFTISWNRQVNINPCITITMGYRIEKIK